MWAIIGRMITKPILIGSRVRLRPITAADAADMFAALSDEESMRLTGTQDTFTLEQVEAFCKRVEQADDRVDYAITRIDDPTQRYVGEVVLNSIDFENRVASFRIALNSSANFGKGYGTEATRLILQHGFERLNLHRIELEVYEFNPRAQHVYEKVGFVREGMRRKTLLWDGEYQGAIIMGILEDEWRAANPLNE